MSARVLAAVTELLERSEDADDALRETVGILADEPGVAWAAIAFADQGETVEGPSAGMQDAARRTVVPIVFQGAEVGELRVDGDADGGLLRQVAELIAAHVLIGWDTGGERWEP